MFHILRTMNRSSLTPAVTREISQLNSRLDGIRSEIRNFMEGKNREIEDIQKRVNSLSYPDNSDAIKRSSSPDMANNKRVKTELNYTVRNGFTQVFTDGACPSNGHGEARAGIGVWWGDGHSLNLSRRVAGEKQTNNVAEIQAAAMALTQAKSAGIRKVEVNTDSQFVINCITKWIKNWKKNGWKTASGKPVINKDDLIELDKVVGGGSLDVKWTYVKGHSDNYGNNQADRLAVAGANM